MFEIDCRLDPRLEERTKHILKGIPYAYEKAAERAVNRTVDKAKTSWAKAMAEEYRITRKFAGQNMTVSKASARLSKLYGSVQAKSKSLELINFVTQKKVWSAYKNKPRIGATVQVKRGGFKGKVRGVFVERSTSVPKGAEEGKLHAMWRVRRGGRVAHREAFILYGPKFQDMAFHVRPAILPDLNRFLHKRMLHEIRNIHRKGSLGL